MRSDPSRVGEGRVEVGSGGGAEMVGSSKVKRGSGKKFVKLASNASGKSRRDEDNMRAIVREGRREIKPSGAVFGP